jgi:small GTP-binding protein
MENLNFTELNNYEGPEDYTVKIIVVGDSGVGKSNILSRYSSNQFNIESKATVGVELFPKTFKVNDKVVKVLIWDTAGQERYKSMTNAYYRGAKGAVIVYDITRPESFNNVDKWFNEIREFGEPNANLLLIGNKCDLKHLRAVDNSRALEKAQTLGLALMETSALDCSNINEAFKKIISGKII